MLAKIANCLAYKSDNKMHKIYYYKYMRGSIAIEHASDAAHRDLERQTAAARKREDNKKDSWISLQTGGGGELTKLRDARDKLERLEKRASNKIKRQQLAKDVAARKAVREYNKAHGIVVPRGPRRAVE
ncbi:uncharacterized protein BDZ99DRAFT_463122 [Mytilinidion resinicola]|uniref:Uncharacterized protein n=1 Tax=Mytilinidion resinicola TaxID=574789 RepID=A0A6A6YKD8_9PEZI|nr:uncharacterized protein BDZ99DRAFT_463122 [Mytilinidion resinicola]KAF2809260.1 hypothetical protein BDZ99DRAFT_463122 [Mytilinidion resinicola]